MKNKTDKMLDSALQGSSVSDQIPALSAWQISLICAAAGGLLAFVGITLSMAQTHTALNELSRIELGSAIAMPFVLGALGFKFKQPFLNALGAVMNSLPY